jgi:signal transduction histidine kinase
MDPSYFANYYKDVGLGAHSTSMMLTLDPAIIFREPASPPEYFGRIVPEMKVWDGRSLDAEPFGRLYRASAIDGTSRTLFYKKLRDYPVVVVVGTADRDIEDSLAVARGSALIQALSFAVCAAVVCALVLRLVGQYRALAAAEETSRRTNELLERTNALQQKTNADLQRSNAELERFAYVASHDLQAPLRAIISYAQLLDRRYGDRLDGEAKEFIAYIVGGANGMSRLIRDLLQFARVSSQGKPLEPVSARQSVNSALARLKAQIDETSARITAGALPTVLADGTQLASLFQNLIDNAIRYRHPQRTPEIAITCERQSADQWRFAVSDNGIGIEKRYFERIFIIFQRLDPARSPDGTGIGLAVCERIVHRFGGRIWVESNVGRGSTFYFTVNAVDALAEADG